jgi:hypothetical protein
MHTNKFFHLLTKEGGEHLREKKTIAQDINYKLNYIHRKKRKKVDYVIKRYS